MGSTNLTDVTDSDLWEELWQRLGQDGLVEIAKSMIEEDNAQRKIDDFFKRQKSVALGHKFERLAVWWESGTMHFSSSRMMKEHPAFQQLVDLGPDIIPLAMERLKRDLGVFWFLVLLELVDNPPDTAVEGDMAEMRKRWVEWEKKAIR